MTPETKTPTRADALAALRGLFTLTDEPEACKLYDVINAHLNATDAPIVEGLQPIETVKGLVEEIMALEPASEDTEFFKGRNQGIAEAQYYARPLLPFLDCLYAQGRTQSENDEKQQLWDMVVVQDTPEHKAAFMINWLRGEIKIPDDVKQRIISAAPPVNGGAWLPIESAPKDGTRVLGIGHDQVVYTIRYVEKFAPQYELREGAKGWYCLNTDNPIVGITYWQPHHAPPSSQTRGG